MNRKMVVGAVLVALAVVMTAGTLVASNMGFKLNYALEATQAGVAKSGTNTLALPDNRQANVNTANQLLHDIGFNSVTQVQRFIASADTYLSYTGRSPQNHTNNFNLSAGEAYTVKMKTTVNYIVVGSDDPAVSYTLSAPLVGTSKSGTNFYAFNYHQTASSAKQLIDDIGFQSVTQVQRFIRSADTFLSYTGRSPQNHTNNFNLTPGEGYTVKMKTTVVYSPSHY